MIRLIKLAVHYVTCVPLIIIGSCLMWIGWGVDKFMGYDFVKVAACEISDELEEDIWEMMSGREL